MSIFEAFLNQLLVWGYHYDTGFLIPAENHQVTDSTAHLSPKLIGFRFESGVQQIDLYIRDAFWDASKSHPLLGESQVFETIAGDYRSTQILGV